MHVCALAGHISGDDRTGLPNCGLLCPKFIGDILIVKPGEKIPVDGKVLDRAWHPRVGLAVLRYCRASARSAWPNPFAREEIADDFPSSRVKFQAVNDLVDDFSVRAERKTHKIETVALHRFHSGSIGRIMRRREHLLRVYGRLDVAIQRPT